MADAEQISSTLESGEGAAAAPPPPAPPSLWILGPWQDLLVFVATPLLILPAMILARTHFEVAGIALFVASFGALGHHLPGMLRAYGDRELLARFKTRFLLAPVFLAAVCILFTVRGLSGIVLVVFLWGVWHGLMQVHCFLRLYDSKVGSLAPHTAQLDHAMCLAWFGAGVILSPARSADLLDIFYRAGGPLIPGSMVEAVRLATTVLLGLVTAAFLINALLSWRRGAAPSPVKLLLMVTSFGFWWYANVTIDNMLVGIALFEIFHDVQYLAIVWLRNRRRAGRPESLSKPMRFLFARGGALVGVYVGLVFAYGSLHYVPAALSTEIAQQAMVGLLLASALLHFYYDSFIWKASTRSGVVEGEAVVRRRGIPGGLMHAMGWSLLFVIPLAWLGVSETRGAATPLERAHAVVQAIPSSAEMQDRFGVELAATGDLAGAVQAYERALELDPEHAGALDHLSSALLEQDRRDTEAEVQREALRISAAAGTHFNLGNSLARQGETEEATAEYEAAIHLQPDLAPAHHNLGVLLYSLGRTEDALEHLRAAVRIDPGDAAAHRSLGFALRGMGQTEKAEEHLAEARRLAQ